MNIFWFEIKAMKKSIFVWGISLSFVTVLFLSAYPAFYNSMTEVKQMLSGFPPEILAAFGLDLNTFFEVLGYYAMVFFYILLSGAICALYLGMSASSKENRFKTTDFLLSKPVQRFQVLKAKLLAILLALVIINLIFLLFSSLAIAFFSTNNFSVKGFLLISLTLFFTQLTFSALGFLVGILYLRIRNVIALSLAIATVFFAFSLLEEFVGSDKLRLLSPFKYFDLSYIIENNSYQGQEILISLAVAAIALVVSFLVYQKRNLPSV